MAFLVTSSLLMSPDSSLFSSIFISQASFPSLLEEEGDNMMLSFDNPGRKQLETRTRDFCVIRWSKPLGDYIMNFYRPKYVSCMKTESGKHTRCPRGRGARPGGKGAPSTLVEPSCPSRTASYFYIFLNIPKQRNIALKTVLESVYLPYHIPIPFWSLKHSGSVPYVFLRGYDFNNIGFNIYGIT